MVDAAKPSFVMEDDVSPERQAIWPIFMGPGMSAERTALIQKMKECIQEDPSGSAAAKDMFKTEIGWIKAMESVSRLPAVISAAEGFIAAEGTQEAEYSEEVSEDSDDESQDFR